MNAAALRHFEKLLLVSNRDLPGKRRFKVSFEEVLVVHNLPFNFRFLGYRQYPCRNLL